MLWTKGFEESYLQNIYNYVQNILKQLKSCVIIPEEISVEERINLTACFIH